MKFLVIIAIIAATSCQVSTDNLEDSMDQHFVDFHKLLPLADIQRVVLEYIRTDKEIQEVGSYLQSKDFADIYVKLFTVKELKSVLSFFGKYGVNAYKYINHSGGFIGLPEIHPMIRLVKYGKGVEGLIKDILALLPKQKLVELYKEKYENAEDFKSFVNAVQGKEFRDLISKLHQSKDYLGFLKTLKEHNLDLVKVLDIVKKYFSSYSTSLGLYGSHVTHFVRNSYREMSYYEMWPSTFNRTP